MATALPPVLEALLRASGRQYPNAGEMEAIGMPMNVPFSNQGPPSTGRAVPDGSLNALSQLIAGLGGPMGSEPPHEPAPRTMFIRPVLSPSMAAGGEPARTHIGGMAAPGGEQAMLQELLSRGGANLGQATVQGYQARAAKTGKGMGIADPELHAKRMADMQADEAARRAVVTNRAMQEAQARSYRQSGMHPQLAALLSAVGGDSELGQLALGDAFGGRGAGLKMREQNMQNSIDNRKLDIASQEQAAVQSARPDLRSTAAKVYAEKLERNRGNKAKAANEAVIEVMKTGVSEAEAKAALAEVAGVEERKITDAGAPKKNTPIIGAYGGFTREPGVGDILGAMLDSIGENIRNSKFGKTGMF